MKEKGPQQQQRRRQLMKRTFGVCARAIQKRTHMPHLSLNRAFTFSRRRELHPWLRGTQKLLYLYFLCEWMKMQTRIFFSPIIIGWQTVQLRRPACAAHSPIRQPATKAAEPNCCRKIKKSFKGSCIFVASCNATLLVLCMNAAQRGVRLLFHSALNEFPSYTSYIHTRFLPAIGIFSWRAPFIKISNAEAIFGLVQLLATFLFMHSQNQLPSFCFVKQLGRGISACAFLEFVPARKAVLSEAENY